jgi:hypothetical protein
MGARRSFNESVHNNPIDKQQWKHQQYGPIHRQYFIPAEYMAPDTFFERLNEPDGQQIVYWKRCCSMYVRVYVMLSKDNPEYKNKREKVNTRPNPRDYRPVKSVAYNPCYLPRIHHNPRPYYQTTPPKPTPITIHCPWSFRRSPTEPALLQNPTFLTLPCTRLFSFFHPFTLGFP